MDFIHVSYLVQFKFVAQFYLKSIPRIVTTYVMNAYRLNMYILNYFQLCGYILGIRFSLAVHTSPSAVRVQVAVINKRSYF